MRILYHHRTLGDGAEGIHVAEIVKAFRRLGHEVRLVSLIGEATNAGSAAQHRWEQVKKWTPGFLYELGEIAYNVKGYMSLSQAIEEFKPGFIYDRYVSYNYSTVAVGRRHGIPVMLEVNSPYSYQKQTFDERLYFKRLSRLFERRICRDASCVVAVSTPLKQFLVSIGVPEGKIMVLPNGADPERFHPGIDGGPARREFDLEGKRVIGFTGILRPWHGLDLLLDAFEKLAGDNPDLHLLIVGDGPIRSELERTVAVKGLQGRVTMTGRQPHDRVQGFIAAMDVAVSPRTTFYASPMKILEYMAMGKAVVAPDTQNIRDILVHEQEGLLFRPEDAGSLAEAIRRLAEDAAVRSRLGKEARRKVEQQRTWLHNARAVIHRVEAGSAPKR